MANFSFTAEDCAGLRKCVIGFYKNMLSSDMSVPNVVDAARPWEDVMCDFQMLIYMYLLNEGNAEIQRAAELKVGPEGRQVPVIRKEAKKYLAMYQKDFNIIRTYNPINDANYLSQYADLDDAISDKVEMITKQTYYPLLNNLLKQSNVEDSSVAQAIAHITTGMNFILAACDVGMVQNHKVCSPLLMNIAPKVWKVAEATSHVNRVDLTFDMKTLEKTMTDTCNVMSNIISGVLNEIGEYAMSIDLEQYVASAEYTKERFLYLQQELHKMEQQNAKRKIAGLQPIQARPKKMVRV